MHELYAFELLILVRIAKFWHVRAFFRQIKAVGMNNAYAMRDIAASQGGVRCLG